MGSLNGGPGGQGNQLWSTGVTWCNHRPTRACKFQWRRMHEIIWRLINTLFRPKQLEGKLISLQLLESGDVNENMKHS